MKKNGSVTHGQQKTLAAHTFPPHITSLCHSFVSRIIQQRAKYHISEYSLSKVCQLSIIPGIHNTSCLLSSSVILLYSQPPVAF